MAQGTTQALSADTPESVASAIRPHDLTPDDGAVMMRAFLLRQAADLLTSQAAEIARLTEALDDVQTAYCNHVMQQPDANSIAQSVADYGSAEAAVKGLHDFQLRIHQTMINHFKTRATQAEAALAASEAQVQAMREALDGIVQFAEGIAESDAARAAGATAKGVGDTGALCTYIGGRSAARSIAAEARRRIAALSTPLTKPPVLWVETVDPLARELAEVVDETWIFLAVWSQTYASERGKKMAAVHAKMLARVHAVMTSAHAAGLIQTVTTTRLPVILEEHGYDSAGLLPVTEGEGRDNG